MLESTFSKPETFKSCKPHTVKVPRGHGQGKAATTILAEQGDYVTLVSDIPYNVRASSCSTNNTTKPRIRKGMRPMHRTTMTMNTQPYTDYETVNNREFSGNRGLEAWEVAYPYPSQHTSQVCIPHRGGEDQRAWSTNYSNTFINKASASPAKIKYPSELNKLNMTEGVGIKQVMTTSGPKPHTLSQYARIHNKLGVMLGPGVQREPTGRREYNVLTGEEVGPALKSEYKRVSGNRVLYQSYRKNADKYFELG